MQRSYFGFEIFRIFFAFIQFFSYSLLSIPSLFFCYPFFSHQQGLLYLLFDVSQPYRFRLSLFLAHPHFIASQELADYLEGLLNDPQEKKYLLLKLYARYDLVGLVCLFVCLVCGLVWFVCDCWVVV
jgi:hypothetical protein